jgi:hypothetical protein
VVKFMRLPLFPRGGGAPLDTEEKKGWPQGQSGHFGEDLSTSAGKGFLVCPTRSVVFRPCKRVVRQPVACRRVASDTVLTLPTESHEMKMRLMSVSFEKPR